MFFPESLVALSPFTRSLFFLDILGYLDHVVISLWCGNDLPDLEEEIVAVA